MTSATDVQNPMGAAAAVVRTLTGRAYVARTFPGREPGGAIEE